MLDHLLALSFPSHLPVRPSTPQMLAAAHKQGLLQPHFWGAETRSVVPPAEPCWWWQAEDARRAPQLASPTRRPFFPLALILLELCPNPPPASELQARCRCQVPQRHHG